MKHSLVVVGASLGGLNSVRALLGALPPTFPLPIVIVQHRETGSDNRLEGILSAGCSLPVQEFQDKQSLLPGFVYVAPPDYHALVEDDHLALSLEEPLQYSRPSIDVLFESAAESYRKYTIGIILTGSNSDGARGAQLIEAFGGMVIVEDPQTAEGKAMPEAALRTTKHAKVLAAELIGSFLVDVCMKKEVAHEQR